jgi:outer membrane protein OmpA-like peptidoglycan-associated protein
MRARLVVVLILLLLGSFVVLAQAGLLSWPVELAVTLNLPIPKQWQKATDRGAPAPVGTPQNFQREIAPQSQSKTETPATATRRETDTSSPENPPKGNSDAPALTIARIASDGPSVFGGTAAPFSQVTVLDGATPVGSATANDRGDWSLVTEYQFANSSPAISVRVGANTETATASMSQAAKAPLPSQATAADHEPPATLLLKKFEDVVAAAREEAKQNPGSAPSATTGGQSGVASAGLSRPPEALALQSPTSQALLSPSSAPSSASQSPVVHRAATTMPVPMTFVYNEATLTPEGRSSARLLLEYLTLKKFGSVTLSGHADERGLPDYNMELSRERLVTIEHVLRDGGYQGKLEMVPKGATEPYTGIDRSKYPPDELYQLDRRVELRVAN